MTPTAPLRADRSLELEFPQVDSSASDCVINLWRTYTMVAAELGAVLRPYNLTLTGFRVVMMLRVNGIVAAWLGGIIVNLLLVGGYGDIALRDFGLLLGALSLSRLSALPQR